jgi:hypothetical protein
LEVHGESAFIVGNVHDTLVTLGAALGVVALRYLPRMVEWTANWWLDRASKRRSEMAERDRIREEVERAVGRAVERHYRKRKRRKQTPHS